MAETMNAEPAAVDVGPEEGGPAPAAPAAPAAPTAESLLKAPYTAEQLEKIGTFFGFREKNPRGFTYTEAGDLEILAGAAAGKRRRGPPAGTIQLKRFVPLDPTERQLIDEARLDALVEIEEEYEVAAKKLTEAWAEYRRTGAMRPVLSANQVLAELDARRSAARSAVRMIAAIENPVTRSILLEERYETRKLVSNKGDPFEKAVYRIAYYDHRAEFEFGKYVPDENAPPQTEEDTAAAAVAAAATILPDEAAYRLRMKDGRVARIFYDTDSDVNGFLSPMWPVEFTMDSVRYACPIQAYEAERARELNKLELRTSLLKTRSGRTVRLMTRKVEGHPANAGALWFKIYTAVYQQHPELKARLLATGTDTLVFADPRDGPSGIGLAHTDAAALDSSKWKGENAAGLAQEEVRTRFREESLQEAPEETKVREAAITEEEQEKARVGAIINAARQRNAFGGR